MHYVHNATLRELADLIEARLFGDPSILVHGVATLDRAKQGDLSFLSHKKYRRYLKSTAASVVVLTASDLADCPTAALVHDNPYLAYAKAVRFLRPVEDVIPGIHPSAVIDPTAKINATANIGPLAVIGAQSHIEAGVFVGPSCVVGDCCRIGAGSRLIANVTLCQDILIGCRVLIHPGAVIGADGFGFAKNKEGWLRIPQLGKVIIGDDVEIGANTTIDRGSLDDTVIANGVILDNLIQIAHNVKIGERTAIVSCTGISGSTQIGRDCLLGGNVGVAGHLDIGDEVCLAAGSKVTRNLQGPGHYGGVLPVDRDPLWRRNIARLRHLDELVRRMQQLERQMDGVARGEPSQEILDDMTPDI